MRIISGKYRGTHLSGPEGNDTRPTSDRVKEALFNILMWDIEESRFLDLFAGTGGIGIEALSRNAEEVVFVDFNSNALKILKSNLEKINLNSNFEIFNNDAFQAIDILSSRGKIFDIIFLDPPYEMKDTLELIETIFDREIIANYGKIIVEHDKRNEMLEKIRGFHKSKQKKYGNTMLTIYGMEEI
ncbi:MAG TPA: 16S rRNA (guanine(966)-N(2))-methyltransferase RsmD [Clostridia bacterium]|nr:16S rRNA (guanine(966)-N(2))-methyltransferase RsmD [Clostridia bacterium]